MKLTTIVGAGFLLATMPTAALAANSENPMVGGAEMFPDKNIVENALNSADHTTLVAAVQAAGLADTLMGEGPFTVFAPTNEAFEKLPAGTVDDLLKPENKDTLVNILTCHVVGVDAHSPAIGQMIYDDGGEHPITTLGGCKLSASLGDNGELLVTDENGNVATVQIPDVDQSNGVIHVIDTVLLPKM
ncbi:fasciclin domain-containing protein [Halomonas huangheensis]|uniref:FAS1 domain-containing protein n=1 Tax=Halomonas huangheensis TaxID=1178482 RepID=W1N6K0_9GAMM|nr:fasciclin domain-containing protein [Halomonas huangheensis]ALM52015.1 fasciclin [Halomonas huangheensis]ERL50565.1 hypothetical protein BJB45_05405 [Halomonas huangheensis]